MAWSRRAVASPMPDVPPTTSAVRSLMVNPLSSNRTETSRLV
jgi:hypothetical protein